MTKIHRLLLIAPLVVLTGLLSPTFAAAQALDGMRFTTQFPFSVDRMILPAGSYTVRRAGSNPLVLELRNVLTLKGTLLIVNRGDVPRQPLYDAGVTFERRGSVYMISSLWDASLGAAVETVLPPRDEARIASDMRSKSEAVVVRAFKR